MSTLLTTPVERLTTMVKRTITDRRAVLRRDQRALLGRLRDRIINSKTQLRYERAVVRFFSFHRARRASPMCTNSWFDPLHFDLALCSFIESLWEEGDSKNEAIDCVSGMVHYLPQLKGKVPGSKRLLVAWSKCELPARASPLNTFFLAALAGKAVALNDRRLAVSLLLGFHCMLRTGELLKIRKVDPSLMERHSRGIVVLQETKSGQRTASSETVVIFDAYLVRMLAIVCRDLAPADFLVGCSTAVFRAKFARLVQEAGLPRCNWKPYSLKRGGATTDFLHHGQLDRTMVRGRWASAKTARLYIDDAVSMQSQLVVTCQQHRTMTKWAAWVPFS